MNKKTILILTSRFPYPLEKGDKLRAYYQIKALSQKYNIVLCSVSTSLIKQDWLQKVEEYCQEVYVFKLNKFKIGLNLLLNMFSEKPFQVAFFYQSSIRKKILKIIADFNIDAVYCQLIRSAEYVKNIHSVSKTLDYMDALSEGMFKRARISKGIKRVIFDIEGKRLKMYENRIYDYFNHHTIISEQDKHKIHHPLNKKIVVIPNGIDDFFLEHTCRQKKEYDIVFVGNLSYPPNVKSCRYIINQILPIFRQKGRKVKVLLSGANPSPKILKLAKNNKNVEVIGWVDDIRMSYCKGKVFVAPLFIGTGLQNKILEAMALNIPCVTTNLVNNALNSTPSNEIMIADTAEDFYSKIVALIDDKKLSDAIANNAYKYVKLNFNWNSISFKIPIFQ
ncbi:MAG TPA: glycosyltransferase [Crocinitomix sp.]|nr:glycosyltransferase [Crocinitomix sp.]